MDTINNVRAKRIRKVYYGHYAHRSHWANTIYPVIRIGGKYLTELNFQVGDAIEVTFEHNKITIAKIAPGMGIANEPKA